MAKPRKITPEEHHLNLRIHASTDRTKAVAAYQEIDKQYEVARDLDCEHAGECQGTWGCNSRPDCPSQPFDDNPYPIDLLSAQPRAPDLRMTAKVLSDIARLIGQRPPELGGMLGMIEGSGLISEFFFDRTAKTNGAAYSPNIANVNKQLREWNAQGVRLAGFVHSHPRGLARPSYADELYAARLMAHNTEMPVFYMPIVQTATRGQAYSIHAFACIREGDSYPVLPCKLINTERN